LPEGPCSCAPYYHGLKCGKNYTGRKNYTGGKNSSGTYLGTVDPLEINYQCFAWISLMLRDEVERVFPGHWMTEAF
jgi:hypothetical protein